MIKAIIQGGTNMNLFCKIWILMLVTLLMCCRTSAAQESAQEELLLFTPLEADELRQTKDDWDLIPHTRSLPDGPLIRIEFPQIKNSDYGPTINIVSPAKILIIFEENHAPINMDSLQIYAKKGWIKKSLTARIKPYIEGNSIKVDKMKVPNGNFTFNISIADQAGTETFTTYRMIVTKS